MDPRNETEQARRPNRRQMARRTCHTTVRYRVEGEWRPATAMDVSRHGCRLRLGEDLARGSDVHVAFSRGIPGDLPPIEVTAKVIWCRVEGLSHQVGLHFQGAPEDLEILC